MKIERKTKYSYHQSNENRCPGRPIRCWREQKTIDDAIIVDYYDMSMEKR